MANDDDLNPIDAVHADDCSVRDHRDVTLHSIRRSPEVPPEPSRRSCIARTQYDQYASPAPYSFDGCVKDGLGVTDHDEIDGTAHRVLR
jgi:hypothetical protein